MTYAIGNIVYGIDLQAPYSGTDPYAAVRGEIEELEDADIITRQYSGNGESPVYFGVDLGEIDECNTISGEELMKMLTPTEEQKREYVEKLEGLEDISPELLAMLQTEPKVFLTWGSS